MKYVGFGLDRMHSSVLAKTDAQDVMTSSPSSGDNDSDNGSNDTVEERSKPRKSKQRIIITCQ